MNSLGHGTVACHPAPVSLPTASKKPISSQSDPKAGRWEGHLMTMFMLSLQHGRFCARAFATQSEVLSVGNLLTAPIPESVSNLTKLP